VRYIYVPLGGRGQGRARQLANIFVVFTFVALWHDMTLQLLLWGWLSAFGAFQHLTLCCGCGVRDMPADVRAVSSLL
jgi:D-alanyl-lipoteichoic acid acyltransferase DltB (MBOAT superfamily)